MKRQLLAAALFVTIASVALTFCLRAYRRNADESQLKAAHRNDSLLKPAHGAVPENQHEKEMLTAALEKKPGHAPVLLKLAQIESVEGHLQESSGYLRKLLETDPDNPEANLELGKVLFQLGDVRGALDHTERILNTHPKHEDALYNMGAIYANIGNRREAMEYWKRLAALHSNSESAQKAQQMMGRLAANNP
ncbi:MAG: hypothetical protein H6Q04_1846 [Acidobacteria bacterium]|nr:hypothetical protein [Acidobacteriota bacterium]